MNFIFGFLLVISSTNAIATPGFTGGDLFEAIRLSGDITVTCREGNQSETRRIYCRGEILNPGEYTYFRGPEGLAADRVFLRATHEDGSIQEKRESYDSEEGKSDEVNLWIRTLFQRPLLEYGSNRIEWNMTQDGQSVADGEFSVDVVQGQARQCRHRWYNSNSMSDCRGGSSVCSQHFHWENYCQ